MTNLLTKEQTCKLYGCTIEQLNAQYLNNAKRLERLYNKAVDLDRKVNGFTADQLKAMSDNFKALAL